MEESIKKVKHENGFTFITGASSGIGYAAALNLLNSGYRLILPCRNSLASKRLLQNLKNNLLKGIDISERVIAPVLDLSDLNSILKSTNRLLQSGETIDNLILNAGLQYTGSKEPRLSSQNYELTFAVNHLGHQYLVERILPLLLKSKSPRVIITASEVHNPEAPGGKFGKPACLGKLQGLEEGKAASMIDGFSKFNADKAYKDSKLCNLLFAQELYRRLESRGFHIPVIAWAPGLVIPRNSHGFFRHSRKYNEFGQRLFALIVRDVLQITETTVKAGELLKSLVTEPEYSKPGFSYFSNKVIRPGKRIFNRTEPSAEANDLQLAGLLWKKTFCLYRDYINMEN